MVHSSGGFFLVGSSLTKKAFSTILHQLIITAYLFSCFQPALSLRSCLI